MRCFVTSCDLQGQRHHAVLCLWHAALSMILMVIIRYISAVLVWILTSLVVLGSLGEVISCSGVTQWVMSCDLPVFVHQRGPACSGGSTSTIGCTATTRPPNYRRRPRRRWRRSLVLTVGRLCWCTPCPPVSSPYVWLSGRETSAGVRLQNWAQCLCADHPAAADAVHEEAGGAHHRSVPCGRKGLHPPPPPHPAALRHLPGSAALLDLLDPGPALPGNKWLVKHGLSLSNTHKQKRVQIVSVSEWPLCVQTALTLCCVWFVQANEAVIW